MRPRCASCVRKPDWKDASWASSGCARAAVPIVGEPQPDYVEVDEARFFSAEEVRALDPIFPLTRVLALRALEEHAQLQQIELASSSGGDYKVFA
mgnify:CR=1 FL=1